tara:strand:+ start:2647 stop:2904 length:258 start_codon:yes stop_codon:yes gene_type:complete
MEEQQSKSWDTAATFETYKEADQKRNELKEEFDLVKVRRCGKGGNLFRVKTWSEPKKPIEKNKKKNKAHRKDKKAVNHGNKNIRS